MVVDFGDMLEHNKPQRLRWRAAIGPLSGGGGHEMVDISQYVNHMTTRISRNADTETATASIDFIQEISNFYDVLPNMPIWADDTSDPDGTGRYPRYFAGFTMRPDATSETGTDWRDIHIECVDNNQLLHFPPRAIGIQYPPGNGTPVVATVLRQSAVADVLTTFEPESMHEIYAGKWLVMANADGSNLERLQVATVNLTGNKTVAAAVPKSAIGTSVTVTPNNLTDITAGMKLYVFNKGGKNDETITVTSVNTGAGTFDAVLNKKKEANWIIMAGTFDATPRLSKTYTTTTVAAAISPGENVVTPASMSNIVVGQILTVHNRTDLYTSSTTVAVGFAHPEYGESPITQAVTPASMTGILAGMRVHAQNADGTDAENVTVESITGSTFTATFAKPKLPGWQVKPPTDRVLNWETVRVTEINNPAGTFKAVFTSSKFANWHVEIIPTLAGGISVKELVADGWQQEVDGILTTIPSLIDTCYTNATPTFLVSEAVADFHDSVLPHLKWEATSPARVLDEVKPYLTGDFETIVDAAMSTTGSLVWVTPRNMFGIEVGKEIVVQNANGTNREVVEVIDRDTIRFQANFTSTKSAGWYVLGRVEMRSYMAVITDTPDHSALWTPLMVVYDAANQDLTTLEIDDEGNPANSVSFVEYDLVRDGRQQVTHCIVTNPQTGAYGEYSDDVLANEIGRPISVAIRSSQYLTNAACDAAARKHVQRNADVLENVNIMLYQQISRNMFMQAKRVRVTARAEGTTPKIFPLINITWQPDENGVGYYNLECGPPIPEMGSPTPYELTGGPEQPYRWILEPVRTSTSVAPLVSGKGYVVDATGGERRVTLPRAADVPGFVVSATKSDKSANAVVYQPQDRETIGGRHELPLTEQGQSVVLQSDGEKWEEVANAGFVGMLPRHDIETTEGQIVWTSAKNEEAVRIRYTDFGTGLRSVYEDLTQGALAGRIREWYWSGGISGGYVGFLGTGIYLYDALHLNVPSVQITDITAADRFAYPFNTTSGNRTLTLPDAGDAYSRVYAVMKVDDTANTVTIDPVGIDLIDGAATKVLTARGGIIIISDGYNWYTVAGGSGGASAGADSGGARIKDTFNRADSAITPGRADTGQAWQVIGGVAGISSNQLYMPTRANIGPVARSGLTDATAKVKFATLGTQQRLWFRLKLVGSTWSGLCIERGTSNYLLRSYDGATFTTITTYTNTTPAADDVLRVRYFGSAITLLVNGVPQPVSTSSVNLDGIYCGVGADPSAGSSTAWDDFEVRPLKDPATLNFVVDGGGVTIVVGDKSWLELDVDEDGAYIEAIRVLNDVNGAATYNLKRATYSGYDTFSTLNPSAFGPSTGNKKFEETAFTSWTAANRVLANGDIIKLEVVSMASGVTKSTVAVKVARL